MTATVLIVDDEARIRRVLQLALEEDHYWVLTAGSVEEAQALMKSEAVDVVVTDLALPDGTGIDLLRGLREEGSEVPVILITAFGTVETAVEAMKTGAFDYVLKPFPNHELRAVVGRALQLDRAKREIGYHREVAARTFEGITSRSASMATVIEAIQRVAPTSSTVLITGETGVGKELVARAVHRLSGRTAGVFVPLNCAAIPADLLEAELFGVARGAYTGASRDRPGKFEVADGGTLFLDEIGDMPLAMQAKLLRVLQEGVVERVGSNAARRVDVRIIAATHRNLEDLVAKGDFRTDLYYRINVLPIEVPPLRARREDIVPVAEVLIASHARRAGRELGLAPEAAKLLEAYEWPGNVRELNNLVERAVLLADGDTLRPADFPSLSARPRGGDGVQAGTQRSARGPGSPDLTLKRAVDEAEREAIHRALTATGDNKTRAAEVLGISVRTLWYKLRALGRDPAS